VRHLAGDGRIHLMRGGAQYDIIEADALRPSSAYSGNLYSEAYFMLVRDSLKANGLAATWAPTVRVHNAFVRVFPYVVSVPGILIGSRSPIDLDRDAIAARLAASGAREYYAAAGIDIERMFAEYLREPARYGPGFSRESLGDFNTDLFPRDEFDLSPPAK
jgi:spermidine synthase